MRAIVCKGFGGVEELEMAEVASPRLLTGQIRIQVAVSGLNRADLLQRRGKYPPPKGESELLGLEVSGVVIDAAPGATRHQKGDRVMALLAGGGYAEEVCVDERLAMKVPPSLSITEAGAVPETYLTAHHNIFHLGRCAPGDRVLVHAGASGVGMSAIQLLVSRGHQVFVTVGSPEKAKACEEQGAVAIHYKTEDFAERIGSLTGGMGVQLILDPVGGNYLERNLQVLAKDSRLIFIGGMGGYEAKLSVDVMLAKRLTLIGSTLRPLAMDRKVDVVARFLADFGDLFTLGNRKPVIDSVVDAVEVRRAHERLETNANTGKVLLKWR